MADGSKTMDGGYNDLGREFGSKILITDSSIFIIQLSRGVRRRTAIRCLLPSAICLLFAACGPGGSRDRDIGPETARRELFLRGYSYKETDFLNAAKEGREAGVKLFLIAGMSPEVQNQEGETPLLLAARFDHAKAARALLAGGADVNGRDRRGFTPLMRAVLNGSEATVRTILEFKPDPGAQTTDPETRGSTALMYAVAKNRLDEQVGTALTWAVYYDLEPLVARLLERGADPNVANAGGGTALMTAALKGRERVVRLLLERGADPAARDKSGKTASDYASDARHPDVQKALREAEAARRKA
jgi:ankyrin repeat protein